MSELSEETANALRGALRAEDAAVWVYGVASAFVEEDRMTSAIDGALRDHENQRGAGQRIMRGAAMSPPPAQPAYDVPEEVTDQTSAIRMLLTAETDCEIGWRSALENSEDPGIRRTALHGLTASATRSTRWRLTIGERPAAAAFPGKPQ